MSNFDCEVCGLPIIENEYGEYVTACNHYPMRELQKHNRGWTDFTTFKFICAEIKVKECK